jgi:transaldolase/glucose-6-phosphate isomerase
MTPRSDAYSTRNLEAFAPEIDRALDALAADDVVARIHRLDGTVWRGDPREIAVRLGWLGAPEAMAAEAPRLMAWSVGLRREGFRSTLLLGMGGSSLAPEVFGTACPSGSSGLNLAILDSTAPEAVLRAAAGHDPATTLHVVSSKSGTTAETNAFLNYFYDRAAARLGATNAGRHFVAVTDPGTPLELLAGTLGFRAVFAGDPSIGGRFSALSPFGLVPAALKGLDLVRLIDAARETAKDCERPDARDNPGARLGAILGVLAARGRDKLTLFVSPKFAPVADWLEQLVAESTGKEGRGILPVCESGWNPAAAPGADRLFVIINEAGDGSLDDLRAALDASGAPLVEMTLADAYALGGFFYLWETATAVAGRILGVNPFDQPDVEATKKKTREVLAAARGASDAAPESPGSEIGEDGGIEAAAGFLRTGAGTTDYIALQAFLDPNAKNRAALEALRAALRDNTGRAVTSGFGPRFLHSTGQLHKGDAGRGLFLQLTALSRRDAPLPDLPGSPAPAPSFGRLLEAQARGDRLALAEKGRRVHHLRLGVEPAADIGRLRAAL